MIREAETRASKSIGLGATKSIEPIDHVVVLIILSVCWSHKLVLCDKRVFRLLSGAVGKELYLLKLLDSTEKYQFIVIKKIEMWTMLVWIF